jgi:hypothetical protein
VRPSVDLQRNTSALHTNATSIRQVSGPSARLQLRLTGMPAVFNPKGGAQTRLCIPRYQNSGTQGPILNEFIKHCGMSQGDKMMIKVEGGCAGRAINTSPPPKRRYIEVPDNIPKGIARRADTTNIDLTGANATLRNPNGDKSLQYISVEFPDLVDGVYDMHLSFDNTQKITNLTVIDEDGDDSYISA